MTTPSPIVGSHQPLPEPIAVAPISAPVESSAAGSRRVWPALLCIAALLAGSVAFVLQPAPSVAAPAHDDQIVRLYHTALGRMPDEAGLAYWSERRENGESLVQLAREMISLPEAQQVSSGDFIVDAYRNALGRDPEPAGYAFWAAFDDPAEAVAAIADSEEHVALTGTLPPPVEPVEDPIATLISPSAATAEPPAGTPADWVDAGHGVYVPPILIDIRFCESRHDYQAANSRSSARGAYQFITLSWYSYGHAERYGVPSADLATPAQQDEAALLTWQRDGTRPWYASRHCWG